MAKLFKQHFPRLTAADIIKHLNTPSLFSIEYSFDTHPFLFLFALSYSNFFILSILFKLWFFNFIYFLPPCWFILNFMLYLRFCLLFNWRVAFTTAQGRKHFVYFFLVSCWFFLDVLNNLLKFLLSFALLFFGHYKIWEISFIYKIIISLSVIPFFLVFFLNLF